MRGLPVDVGAHDPPFTEAPPPWSLSGRGVVALYRRPSAELRERWIPRALRRAYAGGPAAVLLVDYRESAVGAYRELLFIPGRFRLAGGRRAMITRILVSTWESVANGRRNWAIPKELAEFSVTRTVDGTEHWVVGMGGAPLAELTVTGRGPRFPLTTALIPDAWATLVQPRGRELVCTTLQASGWGRFARLERAAFAARRFPDLGAQRPWATVVVDPFRMVFPEPQRVPRDA